MEVMFNRPGRQNAELQSLRSQVEAAARIGGVHGAGMSAAIVRRCEEELLERSRKGRRSRRREEQWWALKQHAALVAAEQYRAAAELDEMELGKLLYAAQYFLVASAAAFELGFRTSGLGGLARECEQRFAEAVYKLSPAAMERAIIDELRRDLLLAAINQEQLGVGMRLDDFDTARLSYARTKNCQRVALWVVAALFGTSRRSSSRPVDGFIDDSDLDGRLRLIYESALAREMQMDVGLEGVHDWLKNAGPGAIVLLSMSGDDVGHVTIVTNRRGSILVVDGQTGAVWTLAEEAARQGASYSFVPAFDPRESVLDVNRGDLADEVDALLNSSLVRGGTNEQIAEYLRRSNWESVRDAMVRLRDDRYTGAPHVSRALGVAHVLRAPVTARFVNGGFEAVEGLAAEFGVASQHYSRTEDSPEQCRRRMLSSGPDIDRDGVLLAVDQTGRPLVVTRLEGHLASIDVATGAIEAGVPAGTDLVLIDIKDMTIDRAKQIVATLDLGQRAPGVDVAPNSFVLSHSHARSSR